MAVADMASEAAEETVVIVNPSDGQAMSLTGDIPEAGSVQDMIRQWPPTAGYTVRSTTRALRPGRSCRRDENPPRIGGELDRMIAANLESVVCSRFYRPPEIRCSTNHSVAALDAASNPAT